VVEREEQANMSDTPSSPKPPKPPTPAEQIAAALGETGYRQIGTIRDLVHVLGPERVWKLCREAQAIDANGGMVTARGNRRTLGGVFFQLAREALPPEDRRRIFDEPWQRQVDGRRQKAARVEREEAPTRPAQQWRVVLVHVPSRCSSDAAAARILDAARAVLGASTYPSPGEATEAGEAAVQAALGKLYGTRLRTLVPPRIEIRAVPAEESSTIRPCI
jgi:hypothetical protein